ncbi:MAG TPA: hybrid sensor histidine kinase/response regulator [Luteitalea sp.]|nr:hybrid sensor histidine kinase/response regulator [Luteitalea sp.]
MPDPASVPGAFGPAARPPSTVSVLAVDDVPDNLDVLDALLGEPGIHVLRAASGKEALELLLRHEDIAVALLDVQMPEMDGFELAELMRGAERTRHVPIIFLTAGAPEASRLFRGYEAGAVDFLFKPLDIPLLRSKVQVFIELFRHRQALAAQLEEHRQLVKMSELLFGVLGHDLRTPLSAIVTSAEVLRLRNREDETTQRVVTTIQSASSRMTRLISQLLDFGAARLGNLPINPRPAELSDLCTTAIGELQDRHTFEMHETGDTVGLWDPDRMLQVLSNLLGNAVQHGSDEPVRVRVCGTDEAHVIVEISNVGTIPEETAATLFTPFVTSQASTRGTGLGLYIVDQIVRAHGGVVHGRSDDGWTTFTVRVPRFVTRASATTGSLAGSIG